MGLNFNGLEWYLARDMVTRVQTPVVTERLDALERNVIEVFPLRRNHVLRQTIIGAKNLWNGFLDREDVCETLGSAWRTACENPWWDGEKLYYELLCGFPHFTVEILELIEKSFKKFPRMLTAFRFGVRVDEGCRPIVKWNHFITKRRVRKGRHPRTGRVASRLEWDPIARKPGTIAPDPNWRYDVDLRWHVLGLPGEPPPPIQQAGHAHDHRQLCQDAERFARAAIEGYSKLEYDFVPRTQTDEHWPQTTGWCFRANEFAFGGRGHRLSGRPKKLLEMVAKSQCPPTSRELISELWPESDRCEPRSDPLSALRTVKSQLNSKLRRIWSLGTDFDIFGRPEDEREKPEHRGFDALWSINPDLIRLLQGSDQHSG